MSATMPSSPMTPETERPPTETPDEQLHAVQPSRRTHGGTIAAYILIVLGALWLLATFVPLGGGVILLAMGLAFLTARLTTGTPGFAVPAGILLGLGAFVAANDARLLPGDSGGWALVFLGLGFFLTYPLVGRVGSWWPLIPGTILALMGAALLDGSAFAPLARYASLAIYWPAAVIALGLWILLRDNLPPEARSVARVVVVVALVGFGALALAVTIAASANPGQVGATGPFFAPGETTTLTAPIASGDRLRVVNDTGGSTRIVVGNGGQVRAEVTRRTGFGSPGRVSLTPGAGEVALEARGSGAWATAGQEVNLVVEAPASAPVAVESTSGSVQVDVRQGPVQIQNASGSVTVARADGSVDVTTSSGGISVSDVAGETRLTSSSGSIDATGLQKPRLARTSSGAIYLGGTFTGDAEVQSSSGSVTLRFAPDSSTRIVARSSSGAITASGLTLATTSQTPNSLDATLGTGAGTLTITTSSGHVDLGPRS